MPLWHVITLWPSYCIPRDCGSQNFVGANINDLDAGEKIITVLGKGQKTRVVPVGAPALTAIAEWMKYRPMGDERLGFDSPLFVSKRGHPY
jgi:integrase/recombinase XerC